ncbi:MAG TPA: hypothetical protein PLV66_13915 [Thermoanaerobaculales bacterium]|nr:hypothetical protein [Thermoanaerobaculales bacterium]
MSLIHEALRKARREPDEEDARGVAYARGLTGRRRRHGLGTGILLGALAVSAGAAAGIGMWLWLGARSGPVPPAPAAVSPAPTAAAAIPGLAEIQPTPAPTPAPTAGPASRALETSGDGLQASETSGLPAGETAPEAEAPVTPGAPVHRAKPTRAAGRPGEDRVFHIQADLDYATLALDFIVARPTDPFARINGMDLRVGSTIEGFTVEEITSTAVRLRDERGPLVLVVP